MFPPCPHLPAPVGEMTAEVLSAHGRGRGAAFYLSALTYGHYLWQRGLVGRAILKLDRAFGADLRGDEPVLRDWPLPYAAVAWILRHTPEGALKGNPRVHFQHLADRMNEPRRDQRRWRAWACWRLTRLIHPDLPGDPRHRVDEPTEARIAEMLEIHGISGEGLLWREVMRSLPGERQRRK